MSVFVEFDDVSFKVIGIARHDRLAGKDQVNAGPKRSRETPFTEDATTRGRSVAHPSRYSNNPGPPGS